MRVNIVGCAPGCDKAPYGQKDKGEIWGINDVHLKYDVDVVIDCHHMMRVIKGKEERTRRSPEVMMRCLKKIKKNNIPCYSVKEVKNAPSIKKYPFDEIVKEFDSDYFGSGPDYAVALAIYKGFTEIHTYGILMIVGDEYSHQKPTFEHWLGVAKGRGIKTVLHDHKNMCAVLRNESGLIYGYYTPQRWLLEMVKDPDKFESYS